MSRDAEIGKKKKKAKEIETKMKRVPLARPKAQSPKPDK